MEQKRSQLEPVRADAIDATLAAQTRESFEWVQRLDEQLTRTHFLTNGGAAIATLAFLGTGRGSAAMVIALALFTMGLIATGVELRALAFWFAALHKDASRRRRGFLNDELRVIDLKVAPDVGARSRSVNHWAGWFAQSTFVAGALSAALAFI